MDTEKTEHLICAICLEVYKNPKALPCLHSFCQTCIQSYISNMEESVVLTKGFECPVCRTRTGAPVADTPVFEWGKLFPSNFALLPVLEAAKTQKKACDPCLFDSITKDAKKYCKDCKEFICYDCIKSHRTFQLLRCHVLVPLEEFDDSGADSLDNFADRCQQHKDKHVKYFCADHDSLCCSACAIVDHRKCEDMKEISVVSKGIKQKPQAKDLPKEMNNLTVETERAIKEVSDNASQAKQQIAKIQTEVKEIRETLLSQLDKFEESISQQLRSINKKDFSQLEEQMAKLKSLTAAVASSKSLADTVIQKGSEVQAFIMLKKLEQQTQEYKNLIKQEKQKSKMLSFELKTSNSLRDILRSGMQIGNVVKQEKSIKWPTAIVTADGTKSIPEPTEAMVHISLRDCEVEFISEKELQIPAKNEPKFIGVACLPGGRMVISDQSNNKVYLFGSSYTCISEMKFNIKLFTVANVGRNQVAVCFQYDKKTEFIEAGESFRLGTSFESDLPNCSCMCQLDDERFVLGHGVSLRPCFDIISSRKLQRRLTSMKNGANFENFWDLVSINQGTKLVLSHYLHYSVTCVGLDGTLFFRYTNDVLKFPAGLSVDSDDNIYVCGSKSDNIHQLTPEGKLIRIITHPTLQSPLGMCFFSSGTEFIVTSDKNKRKAHLFRLKA